jgi:SAM-dependent methyltransferase
MTTDIDKTEAFAERVFQSLSGAFDIYGMYLGDRLGYYAALAGGQAMAPRELASATGTQERYAREWLEQQATTGVLEADGRAADPRERRYRLSPEHAEALANPDSLNYLAPIARLFAGVASQMGPLLEAYRNGGGVPYAAYGRDLIEGQAAVNRPAFLQQLGQEWLPAIPEVHDRLQAGGRVADIGCGAGWSGIGIAQAYPRARVDGYDLDAESIELAVANARAYGVEDRVAFHCRDAGDEGIAGEYDLVIALECVHDVADPVRVLRTMRRLAADRGTVVVVDERVADEFGGDGDDVEWMMYGWSMLHCLPAGMTEDGSRGTGTVMRLPVLRGYAQEAGFSDVRVLPIDNFLFRFYQLTP